MRWLTPTKASERERVGQEQNNISPEGSELKNKIARERGNGRNGIISRALREKRVPAQKRLWRKGFLGRSGILPLHFYYFFSQTPSDNGAAELAQAQALGKRINPTSAESATEHGNAKFQGGGTEQREMEPFLTSLQEAGTRE